MTKEFDAYCQKILSTVKREPTAGKPDDLVVPDMQKEKATKNTATKTETNPEAENHTFDQIVAKAAPTSHDGSGTVKTTVKAGQPIDKETVMKAERAKDGVPLRGKGEKAEVATNYKSGQMVDKATPPTNK